jgi:hypothetical protein
MYWRKAATRMCSLRKTASVPLQPSTSGCGIGAMLWVSLSYLGRTRQPQAAIRMDWCRECRNPRRPDGLCRPRNRTCCAGQRRPVRAVARWARRQTDRVRHRGRSGKRPLEWHCRTGPTTRWTSCVPSGFSQRSGALSHTSPSSAARAAIPC